MVRLVVPMWCLLAFMLLLGFANTGFAWEVGSATVAWVDDDRDRTVTALLRYPAWEYGSDVAVADPPLGGFPAVVIGHGFLMPANVYTYLAEHLAARGYVVALATTGGELFPDHAEFGADLAFLAAELRARGDDPDSPFHQRMGSTAAVVGHSMGGGASVLAAAADPTITAVVGLAPAETNPSAIAASATLDQPLLVLWGTVDCVTPVEDHALPIADAHGGDWTALVGLEGASHCQFAAYNLTCSLGEFACDDPSMSRADQHALSRSLVTSFLDLHLFGDTAGWLALSDLVANDPRLDPTLIAAEPPTLPSVRIAAGDDIGPIVIPPTGGPIVWTASLTNPTPAAISGRIWLVGMLPDGSTTGPLASQTITLSARATETLGPITTTAPTNLDPGLHYLIVRIGALPEPVIDESGLPVHVAEAQQAH